MKILYIYTALLSIGGADRVITEKANYLTDKCEFDVYIITDSQAGRPPVFPLSQKVKHIDVKVDFDEQYHHGFMLRGFYYFKLMRIYRKKLKKLLHELQPDIVITTLGRDIDFLTSLKDGSLKIGESHIAKSFVRNFHLMEQKSLPYRLIAKYWRKKLEKNVKRLDAFVVLTDYDAKSWTGIKNALIIPNSLPFYPKQSSKCENKRIISVGRFNEQKGYERLIDAWKFVNHKHPDWEIDIYGSGKLEEALIKRIKENRVESSFHLNKPLKDIMEKYLESSIYVMSSRFEGFGMVLIEAMACGVPCISFDCPYGPSDIIRNEEDGLLVENGNINKLSEAICFLIENEEMRKEFGKQAKINIKRYTPEIIMQQWTELFTELIEKGK